MLFIRKVLDERKLVSLNLNTSNEISHALVYPIILPLSPSYLLMSYRHKRNKVKQRKFNYLVSKISPQIPLITQHEQPSIHYA